MADHTSSNPGIPGMDRKIRRPWWQGRAALAALSAVALAMAGGLAWINLPPPGTTTTAPDAVDIGAVVEGPFQDYVPLRASVVPLDITYITAIASGQVAAVTAQDGDSVATGQALARLDNPDLIQQVATSEADVSGRIGDTNNQLMTLRTSEAQRDQALADAEYALHTAQEDLQKRQHLRDQGVLNDAYVKPYADAVTYQTARVETLKQAQSSDAGFFAAQKQ